MCFLVIVHVLSAGSSLVNLHALDLQDVGEAPGETFAELGLDDRLLLASLTLLIIIHTDPAIPHDTLIDPTTPSKRTRYVFPPSSSKQR